MSVAIVTGAASGIGRAVALELARGGTRVLAVDIDLSGAEETASLAAGTVVPHRADVSKPDEVEGYVRAALSSLGTPDKFFNNAGIAGANRTIVDMSVDEWSSTLAINLNSMFYGLKYVLPHMIDAGRGQVVNTGSIASLQGAPKRGDYVASKHATLGLTRTAAAEVRQFGIAVNCICPGSTDTPIIGKFRALLARDGQPIPAQGVGGRGMASADEIARTAAFLLRDDVPFLTGTMLSVDGGASGQY
ncbi:SDR family oxidoreductase [Rhodococcus sp. BP-252]|uniref:Short-chain dehydrogenase n=2 Tax=Mycobacteriales TaxID=85007 RepID=A0A177YLN9_9NOCA|nr:MULTISPECIES: SDR family NAD(P)-dependent oxidoreductase [unclassified Rhodococcus (in: high G+C Gram-positive bacteria)]MBY6423199.1 SDR family oxidoreductase [Rhodococcus sp. BP-324]MBY6470578.1 SDR family oxidoreductase [Rhodococcus sp. BP-313]MBY6475339.1 SDR family oxidoreductase [Rhodococcus sp. BP-261]MBY6490612.1 SDR family oxidoreductase [Rhodococcus sp. BP-291]MBY6499795.1 SDR family oxidoreductase [Rhodococcus sp. BP-262]MBY6559456.1 SDR family oxidoreductase [Rhodococcus sp. BP